MIRQQVKDVYYSLTRFLTIPSYYIAKLRFGRRTGANGHYLHLGCGPNYIPGMINIDGNVFRKIDLWMDLRNGLPFKPGSVFFVFCSHMLEHLFPDEALRLLGEIHRVLRPDGVAHIAVPSFEHTLDIAAGKAAANWPHNFDDPSARQSFICSATDNINTHTLSVYSAVLRVRPDFAM